MKYLLFANNSIRHEGPKMEKTRPPLSRTPTRRKIYANGQRQYTIRAQCVSVRVWRPTVEGVMSHDMEKSRKASQRRKSYEERERVCRWTKDRGCSRQMD